MNRIAATITALLCLPPAALAQTPTAPPLALSLDDAIARSLSASHQLAAAAARADADAAAVGQRHADALPSASASAAYMRTNHVPPFGVVMPNQQFLVIFPDLPNNYSTRLDLQWPIYTGGRLDALERAARAEAVASAEEVAAARADLRLEVTRAYWALVTSREAVRVVDTAVEQGEAHLRDVRNQFGVGLLPPSDIASAEAQLSHERMLAVQARSQRDVAEIDLGRLIGAAAEARIEPTVSLDAPAIRQQAADALVAEARGQRPERAALAGRAAAAHDRFIAADAGRLPTVGIAGGVDYARPNPNFFPRQDIWQTSWDAAVNVSWPLFDGGRTRAAAAEAAAAARAARERLADFDVAMSADVRARLRELEASGAAIDAAAAGVRSAAEARRVIADRFSAGVATSTDVLEAQAALLQAELDRTEAVAAARLAEARLARALGR